MEFLILIRERAEPLFVTYPASLAGKGFRLVNEAMQGMARNGVSETTPSNAFLKEFRDAVEAFCQSDGGAVLRLFDVEVLVKEKLKLSVLKPSG